MPNWVFNGLTIEGKSESVIKLADQMNQPFKVSHMSVWDSTTNTSVTKDILHPAPIFAFWNIIKPTDLEAYHNHAKAKVNLEAKGEDMWKEVHAEQEVGMDWYNWNLRNWGVKWDVAVSGDDKHPDTYMEGPVDNGDNKVVFYNFNTAWGVPMEALTNLSSQYPNLLFTLCYEEETGWGGETEILNGVVISDQSWNWQCSECDFKYIGDPSDMWCEDCENEVCRNCFNGADIEKCEDHREMTNA